MSNQESSSEYVDPAPGTAAKGPLIIASLLLAVPVLFVVFAVISAAVLNF